MIIPGEFWDCQLYRGRLYLWDTNNSLIIYDWDALIDELSNEENRLALTCAFTQGDYLYGDRWSLVFSEHAIVEHIQRRFDEALQQQLIIGQDLLSKHRIGILDNPFGDPQDDSEIYNGVLYGVNDAGLHGAKAHKPKRGLPVDRHAEKLWDGRATSIRARSFAMALAALGDGLFEIPNLDSSSWDEKNSGEPHLVSKKHTSFVNWSFSSIYGTSLLGRGYMAAYGWHEIAHSPSDQIQGKRRDYERRFERIIDDTEIFDHEGVSWGCEDKLYCIRGKSIEVSEFRQLGITDPDKGAPFRKIAKLPLAKTMGRFANASVTLFGTIIEFEEGILILRSDGKEYALSEPVVRWRAYPRSIRYENQLHVIFENRLEILSFNHDYFVDQEGKKAGTKYRDSKRTAWAT